MRDAVDRRDHRLRRCLDRRDHACSRFGSAIAFGVPNSRMSAPPENALPAPVSTIALTAASSLARARGRRRCRAQRVAEAVDRRVVRA